MGRHIGRHIAGNPDIVVQNLPAAGSMTAAANMLATAPRDGTVITALFNTLPVEPLIRAASIPVDLTEMVWGQAPEHMRHLGENEVKTLDDTKAREVVVAATEPSSNAAIYPQVINEMLGTNFRIISGYTPGESLALERQEVDGICGMSYQTLLTSNPDWIAGGRLNILAQIGMEVHPDTADVPLLLDMIEEEDDRQVLAVFMIQQEIGRPFAAAPGIPPERLEALQNAFAATMADPDFFAEAGQMNLMIEPLDAAATTDLVSQLYSIPEPVIERVQSLLVQ